MGHLSKSSIDIDHWSIVIVGGRIGPSFKGFPLPGVFPNAPTRCAPLSHASPEIRPCKPPTQYLLYSSPRAARNPGSSSLSSTDDRGIPESSTSHSPSPARGPETEHAPAEPASVEANRSRWPYDPQADR